MAESSKQLNEIYSPAVEKRLERFPPSDRSLVADWLLQRSIGTNYALQILEFLEDLARKEGKSSSAILQNALSQTEEGSTHGKEQGRRVREWLHQRLHPKSHDHRIRFESFVECLGLPQGVQLKPPQNFEGRDFQLQLTFDNLKTLTTQLRQLEKSLSNPEWGNLREF